MVKAPDVYGSGRSYEADLLAQAVRHARVMRWFGIGGMASALAFAVGLAFMQSRHTVVSHLVMVDRATGMAEVVSVTQMRSIPLQGIEATAWARRYVTERERYNYGIVQADYNSTIALSTDEVAKAYDADVRARAEQLANRSEEQVRVTSVTLPQDAAGRAIVRFDRRTVDPARPESPGIWKAYIATLAYRFVPSPMGSREVLSLNPLGFKVSAYVTEPEIAK